MAESLTYKPGQVWVAKWAGRDPEDLFFWFEVVAVLPDGSMVAFKQMDDAGRFSYKTHGGQVWHFDPQGNSLSFYGDEAVAFKVLELSDDPPYMNSRRKCYDDKLRDSD